MSVNTQRVWKHYWILMRWKNAISYESVKVDPKLKIYDLQDHERAQKAHGHLVHVEWFWLPVVIGSRSDKATLCSRGRPY